VGAVMKSAKLFALEPVALKQMWLFWVLVFTKDAFPRTYPLPTSS